MQINIVLIEFCVMYDKYFEFKKLCIIKVKECLYLEEFKNKIQMYGLFRILGIDLFRVKMLI